LPEFNLLVVDLNFSHRDVLPCSLVGKHRRFDIKFVSIPAGLHSITSHCHDLNVPTKVILIVTE